MKLENLNQTPNSTTRENSARPEIPQEAFLLAIKDLYSHEGYNPKLKHEPEQIVKLGVNSTNHVRYQILDTRNGLYLLSKLDRGHVILNETPCEVMISTGPRNLENPDLLVCNEHELDLWKDGH